MSHQHKRSSYGEIEEILDDVETYFRTAKSFDVLDFPPSDHRFISSSTNSGCAALSQLFKASLVRRMREEWKIFDEAQSRADLGIHVRVYSSSADVMRAAIIAEDESSYHHGLFFFDIRFPRNYPSKPPQLFYHSFGESHYANTLSLDREGTLLLDQISGGRSSASVLELLVLIRRSVLTAKRNSEKSVLMKSCGAMEGMMRRPPRGFEVFVAGYFRTRAHRILLNLRSRADLWGDSELKTMFFRLVRAFERNGTYCRHHYSKQQYDEAFKADTGSVDVDTF